MQVVEADNATYLETTSGQSVRIIRKNLLAGRVTVHVVSEVSNRLVISINCWCCEDRHVESAGWQGHRACDE